MHRFEGNFAVSGGGAIATAEDTVGLAFTYEPEITNCTFTQNEAGVDGGAIFMGTFNAGIFAPTITHCEFTQNEAFKSGGAMYLRGDQAIVDQCVFTENETTVMSGGDTNPGSGGAVFLTGSQAHFTSCQFFNNVASGNPTGALEGGGGGAVHIVANESGTNSLGFTTPVFTACGFFGNSTGANGGGWGGAVLHRVDGGVLTVNYINCVFAGNMAENDGGAAASFSRQLSDPAGFTPKLTANFTSCTFANNSANDEGGAILFDEVFEAPTEGLVENSILWNNTATTGNEIFISDALVTVTSSLIEGSGGSGGGWDISLGIDGGNNLDDNPDFVDITNPLGGDMTPGTNDDGLKLQNTSPALNMGDNAAAGLLGITEDFAGEDRFQDTDTDMGAYEGAVVVGPSMVMLCPVQDAYLQFGTRFNNNLIRTELNKRTGYLQFDLSEVAGDIISAQLEMTVDSDPGWGDIKIFKGTSNSWTENNISLINRPLQGAELAVLNTTYKKGQTYTWNLDVNQISGGDLLSLVIRHANGNDVAFASKENGHRPKPKLILKVNGGVPSCTTIRVVELRLVNADNGNFIKVLNNGSIIDRQINPNYNIVAVTEDCNGQTVESVLFRLNGNKFQTENFAPYAMGGDLSGSFKNLNLEVGNQTIKATPFTQNKGNGNAGTSVEIIVTVIDLGSRNATNQALSNQNNSVIELHTYPNPSSEEVGLRMIHPNEGKVIIQITDLLGRVVLEKEIIKDQKELSSKLNVSKLVEGTYLLKVKHQELEKITRLIIDKN